MRRLLLTWLLITFALASVGGAGIALKAALDVPGVPGNLDCSAVPNSYTVLWYDTIALKTKSCQNGVPIDLSDTTAPGTGITSINALSPSAQTLVIGATGTDFNISSATSIHTFNIPSASAAARGLVTTGAQTFAGVKTFQNGIVSSVNGNSTTASALAVNPADCAVNQFANSIDASGTLGCTQVDFSQLSGVAGTLVRTDQANTYTTGIQNFAAALGLTLPVAPGASPTVSGRLAYDSTSNTLKAGVNGVNKTIALTDSNISGSAASLSGTLTQCLTGNAATGISVSGASAGCFDVATQLEFDTHANATVAHGAAGGIVGLTNTQTLQNKTLDNSNILTIRDDRFTLQDNLDTTKQATFQLTNIPTGTTRSVNIPGADNSTTVKSLACSGTDKFRELLADGTLVCGPDQEGAAGAGITTLNTLTATNQSFAFGITGTDLNISSSAGTHTFNVPSASATSRGVVSIGAQTFAGAKTFAEPITASSGLVGNVTGSASNLTCAACVSEPELDFNPATQSELDAHASATSGIHGITSTAALVLTSDTRLPSIDAPTGLSNASQITCNKPTIYVGGSSTPVTLNNPNWLVAGTFVGQECSICGSHDTFTVTGPNTASVRLDSNTGTVTVGANLSCVDFTWLGTQWRQRSVPSAQQTITKNKLITGLTTAAPLQLRGDAPSTTGFDIYDDGTGNPVIQGVSAGGPADIRSNIPAGKSDIIFGNNVEFDRITAAGVHTYSNAGKPRGSIYIPAEGFFMQGCTLSTDVPVISGGHNGAYIICGANNAHGYHRDLEMPDSWDGGPINISLSVVNVNAAPASNHEMDFSGMCVGNGIAYGITISITGEQPATFNFGTSGSCGASACAQNARVVVTTGNITPNGTCTGSNRLLRLQGQIDAAGTGATQVGDVRHLGVKLEYLKNSRSD